MMGNLSRISADVNEDVERSGPGTVEGHRVQQWASSISEYIERSALGTPEGRALRRRTSSKVAQGILDRAAELERATQHKRDPDPVAAAEFSAFYRKSVPRLVAFLWWQGASMSDAADCVQEAMAQVYGQWLTLRYPYVWCRQIASRLYAQRLASLEEPVADPGAAGSSLFARDTDWDGFEERRHCVPLLLEQLPARQRQVMAWDYDGSTPTEIAEVLKIPPEAVRDRLNRISATLKMLLGKGVTSTKSDSPKSPFEQDAAFVDESSVAPGRGCDNDATPRA
jgi:DNA-directed RNA polymerase specialized sigma24 family protein